MRNSDGKAENAADSLGFLDAKEIRLDPSAPKASQIYTIVRNAIVSLDLPPGNAINEKAFCERLEVSRTPFREAILRLSNEHLVTVIPNSGTRVSKIDLQDVFDGQFVREAIELKSTRIAAVIGSPEVERDLEFNMFKQQRLAAENDYDDFYALDEEFHAIICSAGSSSHVWDAVHQVKAQLDRVRRLAFPAVPGNTHLGVVFEEHSRVFDAIRAKDADAAVDAMAVHLVRIFRTIRELLGVHTEFFSDGSARVLELYENHRRVLAGIRE